MWYLGSYHKHTVNFLLKQLTEGLLSFKKPLVVGKRSFLLILKLVPTSNTLQKSQLIFSGEPGQIPFLSKYLRDKFEFELKSSFLQQWTQDFTLVFWGFCFLWVLIQLGLIIYERFSINPGSTFGMDCLEHLIV